MRRFHRSVGLHPRRDEPQDFLRSSPDWMGNDCCRAIEAMAIEIVDLPIEHGDVP